MSDVLKQGNEAGCFKVDNVRLTSLAIMNMTTFTYTWYRESGSMTADDLAEHFTALAMKMVSA